MNKESAVQLPRGRLQGGKATRPHAQTEDQKAHGKQDTRHRGDQQTETDTLF